MAFGFKLLISLFEPIYKRIIYVYAKIYSRTYALAYKVFDAESRERRICQHLVFDSANENAGSVAVREYEETALSWGEWMNSKEVVEDETVGRARGKSFTQVGGHAGAFEKNGSTIKKLADPAELEFYEKVNNAVATGDSTRAWPVKFLPAFSGVTVNAEGKKQMILENLLDGYTKPCILDLKIGTETVGEDAKTEKVFRMMWRDVKSGAILDGVRLVAMSVYHPRAGKELSTAKKAGDKINEQASLETILGFFLSDGDRLRWRNVNQFLSTLEALLEAFEENHTYKFIGSSLLFVYEGSNIALAKAGLHNKCDLHMIDFAHVAEEFAPIHPVWQVLVEYHITGGTL
ncbi:hypothetical protein CYMTET_19734 [Cymbomonas tetramitiformis]|uniref:Inositol polyphosphate multikinase n=1 Tax=Cymbomonas tetramitiformis TaxID=36881 RepID=A0AAE0G6Q2_9CHLO|nr:hypothetical protein CYMTET_44088 [Cymbomonas tetramitiformis]KAK3271941.1 hypothetical protein CYMTET_19734 [Cymbomonas tetramitiformis]